MQPVEKNNFFHKEINALLASTADGYAHLIVATKAVQLIVPLTTFFVKFTTGNEDNKHSSYNLRFIYSRLI